MLLSKQFLLFFHFSPASLTFLFPQTLMNTLVPLWPTHSTEYQEMATTTVINQTISTSVAEFSTVLNTTVLFYTDAVATNTWEGATTAYQTMEYQHQSVLYTDRENKTHTTVEDNSLPFV